VLGRHRGREGERRNSTIVILRKAEGEEASVGTCAERETERARARPACSGLSIASGGIRRGVYHEAPGESESHPMSRQKREREKGAGDQRL
jgi:hypothetical protein